MAGEPGHVRRGGVERGGMFRGGYGKRYAKGSHAVLEVKNRNGVTAAEPS